MLSSTRSSGTTLSQMSPPFGVTYVRTLCPSLVLPGFADPRCFPALELISHSLHRRRCRWDTGRATCDQPSLVQDRDENCNLRDNSRETSGHLYRSRNWSRDPHPPDGIGCVPPWS